MALEVNDSSKYLQSLIESGSDAMSNLYYVEFLGNSTGVDMNQANLIIRNKNFKMPTFSQETHSVNFLTTSVDLPTPSVNGTKELDFSFRMDGNYDVYRLLKNWQSFTSLPTKAYAINKVPGIANKGIGANVDQKSSFQIKVYRMDGKFLNNAKEKHLKAFEPSAELGTFNNGKLLYTFNYCWVKSLSGLSFSYDSADPVTVSAKVAFLDVQIEDEIKKTRSNN